MKVVSSIGTMKKRHPDCQVVKRRVGFMLSVKVNPNLRSDRAIRKKEINFKTL